MIDSDAPRNTLGLGDPPGKGRIPVAQRERLRKRTWYRAHAADLTQFGPNVSAWYYASAASDDDMSGRCDLSENLGTCYIADDPEAAVRERLGHVAAGRPLTEGMLAHSAVSIVMPTSEQLRRIADTTAKRAAEVVTGEIGTTTEYTLTKAWARHWAGAGYTGIRYWPRFSTARSARSLALFGRAGPRKRNTRMERKPCPAPDLLADVVVNQGGPVTTVVHSVADTIVD